MKLNNKGFSLVELMVVVAIIGILASVAVPSINKYMAKSRQSEAKTNLGSLYTAEKAFAAEYTKFHTAFQAVGFSPEGKMRYNIGFQPGGTNADFAEGYGTAPGVPPAGVTVGLKNTKLYCLPAGPTASCTLQNGATGAQPPDLTAGTTAMGATGPTFTAQALAVLMGGAVGPDEWRINEIKNLTNDTNGIP